MKKRAKKTFRLSRKDAASDNLLKAVGRWVKAYGGTAAVAGGIGISEDPMDQREYVYRVSIKVMGKRPVKSDTPRLGIFKEKE
jgi:hypothetical protein